MDSFSGMDGGSIKVEREIHDQFGIDELDHIPLKERLKMLFASKQSGSADLGSGHIFFERESKRAGIMPPMDITVKKDDNNCSSQDPLICHSAFGFAKEVMDNYHPKDGLFSQEQGCFDKNHCSLYNDNSISNGSDYADVPAIKVKSEIHDEQFSQKHIYFGTALERSITEVPNEEVAVDPYTVSLCSQNATGCQYDDMPKDCSWQGAKRNSGIYSNKFVSPEANSSVQPDNVVVNIHNQPQPQPENISVFPIKVKVEYPDNDQLRQSRECIHGTGGEDIQAIMIKSEIHNEVENDELDHTVLKERQKMLLSRYPSGTAWRADVCGISEDGSKAQYADLIKDINQPSFLKSKEESTSADEQASFATSFSPGILQTNASKLFRTAEFDSSNSAIVEASCRVPPCSSKAITFQEIVSPKPTFNESDSMCSYHKTSAEFEEPGGGQEFIPPNSNNMLGTSLSTNPVKVKVETSEDVLQSPCKSALGTFNGSLLPVKVELATPSVTYEDELDHMPLQERIKFLISKKVSKLDCSRNVKHLKKNVTSDQEGCPSLSENKYRGVNRQRKRKKTATDSVETALEEDAPGLLQVLVNKGITVDEIKLYGVEKEDDLDASFNADNFLELEVVISKLFSQRPSLLKFAPIRCRKEAKASYCLACLVSLVEQTRYLQFRKWPVEWGWCRDLQSFIFVFERHNRIVLERPEYGYATYFFELVDSLPISWQVKRLVTAMKLTSCSRITLIENRSLLVGDDLTEGEARVLEEYGWTPNSGLGSMLNYCDRVVHDRRNESDGSEWRSKIGKLLMDGMNGGTIVVSNLPKKVIEYKDTHNPQIKLEL